MRMQRLGTVSAGAALMLAAGLPSSAAPEGGRRTIRVTEVSTPVAVSPGGAFQFVPEFGQNPGIGATIHLNSTLEDGQGRPVGTAFGYCRTTGTDQSIHGEAPGRVATCTQTLVLKNRGHIAMMGVINQDDFEAFAPQKLSIVGGTGEFSDARGTVTIEQLEFPGVRKAITIRVSH